MKKIYILLVMLLIGALQTVVAQFRVVGYQPYWAGSAASIQYSKLTHINYAFALPQSDGRLKPLNNPAFLQQIVTNAHAVGTKVFIAIGGYTDNGVLIDPTFETLASTSQGRTNLVNDALALVQTYNLDGVDMDWEFPDPGTSATNFAALMQQLSTALHSRGKELSAAVNASYYGPGIYSEVFNYVDFLNVMAYDNEQEANHSSYSFAQASLNYWVSTRGLPRSKMVLGVPFYARPSWLGIKDLIARGANPNSDQFGSDYYNGIPTIQAKTELAWNQGGGIMIWELSHDATGQYSLLSAIHSKIQQLRGSTSNQAPSVTMISPANGATFTAPASITVTANATDSDGTISKVEFYRNGILIGTDLASPYSFSMSNVAAGNYSLTAKAYDNLNAVTTSTALSISVVNPTANQLPSVSITSPVQGAAFTAPATITINANASDSDGSISRVDFYNGSTLLGSDNTSPYSFTWSIVAAGNYSIIARAFDNTGASATSSAVAISVTSNTGSCTAAAWNSTAAYPGGSEVSYEGRKYRAKWWTQGDVPSYNTGAGRPWEDLGTCSGGTGTNQLPSVSISSPSNGASFTAPATITIQATASDADGTISRVEFYQGTILIGSDNAAPYSASWTNVTAGNYTITAKAIDNLNGTTTSASVALTVTSTSSGTCSSPAWSASAVYVANNLVSHKGRRYRAKWWTQGEEPGTTGQWGVWEDQGMCTSKMGVNTSSSNNELEGVFPNPVYHSSNLGLVLFSEHEKEEKIYILTSSGEIIIRETIILHEGQNNVGIDIQQLKEGFYLVKAGEKTFKFSKNQ